MTLPVRNGNPPGNKDLLLPAWDDWRPAGCHPEAGHLFSDKLVLWGGWDVKAKPFGHRSGLRPVSLSRLHLCSLASGDLKPSCQHQCGCGTCTRLSWERQSPLLLFLSRNAHVSRRVGMGWTSLAPWTPTESRRMVSSPTAETRAGPNMVTTIARLPWSAATGHVAEDCSSHQHRHGDMVEPTSCWLPACRASHHQHTVVHLLFYKPWLGH